MARILFTASTYSHLSNFHRPYMAAFQALGWEVDAACGGTPMPLPEAGQVIHIPFEKQMTSLKNGTATLALRRLIREGDYTLISCHTALAAFFTRMAVRGMAHRPKVACTAHGYLFNGLGGGRERLLRGAEALTAPVTDLLMTMNGWDTAYAKAHHLGSRVEEIPGMGLNCQPLSPEQLRAGAALRRQVGEDRFLLVYAAEFSQRKDQSTLLRALARLPEQVCLLLPGQGALWEECRRTVSALGLEGRVVLPGQVEDMGCWYAAADAAISSSPSEGLPFNLMEAMYHALPIVASAAKGNTELITHGETGLLFPPGDDPACAQQVALLLEQGHLGARLGRQARLAVEPYRLEHVLPRVMELYGELVPLEEAVPV